MEKILSRPQCVKQVKVGNFFIISARQWSNPPNGCYLGLLYTHYNDVIIGTMASQITSLKIVYSTVYSDADQRKHQSSASLAFVGGIHRRPVNSPHKWPVTRKMFPFDDVIMTSTLMIPTNSPHLQYYSNYTMTPSNGNIFRVNCPLWGEPTGQRWFLSSVPEQMLEQAIETLVIWDVMALIMTSL